MKLFPTILLLSCFLHAQCQTLDEVWILYGQHKYSEALKMARKMIQNDTTDKDAYLIIGRLFCDIRRYDSAINYLEQAIKFDDDSTNISGWAYAYLGNAHIMMGDKGKGIAELNKSISLNKTINSVKYAQDMFFNMLEQEKKYAEAIDYEMDILAKDSTEADADACLSLGTVFLDILKYDSAIFFLQKAVLRDDDRSWVSAWAHVHLGEAYMGKGETEKVCRELNKTIELNKTKNSVMYARRKSDSIGCKLPNGDEFPKWITIESENIIYHFQDTFDLGLFMNRYIKEHDSAYLRINKIFQAALPQKLVFYVWNNLQLAKKLLGRDLGFTEPQQCICEVHQWQTIGHEMTHALSYWGWGITPIEMTRLINEGVAVAFHLSGRNKYQVARKALEGKGYHSILEIWNDDQNISADIIYPIGGAFLTYLYRKSTPEQFKELIKNQTIESAKNIYGEEQFNKIIEDFDNMMELSK